MSEAGSASSPSAPASRRHLAILFSDLSDSTRIAGRLDPEDYADLLTRLRAEYHRAVEAHGGAVAQISGDGMLAIFGYPEAREDDGRRAVEAAIALHRAVEALEGEPLHLHSGVHAGLVLLREGDDVRGRFEVTGNATNIAAKLCGLAEAGQILVGEAALGPERHLFETSERSRLALKGKDEPVAVLAVHGLAPSRRRYAASVRGGLTPFVGRAAELEGLDHALEDALGGHVRFVEIEGPPGVGKTRLAEELLGRAAARGAGVHRGECDAAAAPLQPILQIQRSLLGLAEHEANPAAPEASLRALIEGGAARDCLVLFLDDWHLADDASREMIGSLRDLEGGALLVLATARPGEGRISDFDMLPLAPFDAAETEAAVIRLLAAPDPFTIARVRESSGGNALFIEELCHSIADGRMDDGNPWLDTLIESRLSRLPEAEAALVRQAAVIGTIVPAWLLETISGHGEDDPLVKTLARQDFVFPGEREGMLRFKHGLTRQAVYDSVRLQERRALHRQIAATLIGRSRETGEDEPHESLAYHCAAGEDWAAAAHHAELAGDRAASVSALDRAQAQYKAALAALDRLPASDEIAYRWGRIAQRYGLAGVFDPSREQLPVFERAVERAGMRGDEAAMAWAEYWLGYINYALGDSGLAVVHCERALRFAERVADDPLIVQIRATLGQAKAAACDYDEALRLLDEAIAVKHRHRTGARPPIGFAYSTACKGFVLGDLGRFEEAHRCYDEALAAIGGARDEVVASILTQRSAVCLWQGEPEEALRYAGVAEKAAERAHSLYCYGMARTLGGYALWLIDRDPTAPKLIAQAASRLEASGRLQFTSLNYGWLAEVMAETGRFAEARHYAACAMMRARKGDRLGIAMAWRAAARAAAAEGRPGAARYLCHARRAAEQRGSPHELAATHLCEAELALAAGEARVAEAARAAAMMGFQALGMERLVNQARALARPDTRPRR